MMHDVHFPNFVGRNFSGIQSQDDHNGPLTVTQRSPNGHLVHRSLLALEIRLRCWQDEASYLCEERGPGDTAGRRPGEPQRHGCCSQALHEHALAGTSTSAAGGARSRRHWSSAPLPISPPAAAAAGAAAEAQASDCNDQDERGDHTNPRCHPCQSQLRDAHSGGHRTQAAISQHPIAVRAHAERQRLQ